MRHGKAERPLVEEYCMTANGTTGKVVRMTVVTAIVGLVSSVLGGAFGALTSVVAGDSGLTMRVTAAMGMTCGLVIGAAVACLGYVLTTVLAAVSLAKKGKE